MAKHVTSALFVHDQSHGDLIASLRKHEANASIVPVAIADFLAHPTPCLEQAAHVVVAAELPEIKQLLLLADAHGFSVGFIPDKGQKVLRTAYALPTDQPAQIELALRASQTPVDLTLCNGEVVLLKAVMGRLPLIEAARHKSRFWITWHALRGLIGLRLRGLRVETAEGQRIRTAACGCAIVQRFERRHIAQLFPLGNSLVDGMLSLVVVAPMAISNYITSLANFLTGSGTPGQLPATVGYIRSRSVTITSDQPVPVSLDGVSFTSTPLSCEVRPRAVSLNLGKELVEAMESVSDQSEIVDVKQLPAGRELAKALDARIPLFAYASEERFRDLFSALKEDAHISGIYIMLMLLSSLLATVGLFLSSASVVIGAMLLAPLMAPIMSLSMGLVRQEDSQSLRSIQKILLGIAIALGSAALFSLMITHKPVTPEMTARLNPSLLDLAVAILAGVAGATTKSFKEILQSLAGVAIAVALVPPLAVAGIGLGRGDLVFFSQAFLLFLTNLTGITIAAALTFRVLGYSPAVRNRRGIAVVLLMLIAITVPLKLSYSTIVGTEKMETNWRHERFLVGGKYLIVEKADLRSLRDQHVLYVDVLAREPLTRTDLAMFKEKVLMHFSQRLIVRVRITYIL